MWDKGGDKQVLQPFRKSHIEIGGGILKVFTMNLPDAWNNYKSFLAILTKNDHNSIKDFLIKLCSTKENLTNSTKLTQLFALAVEFKNCEIVSVLLQHGVRGKPCEELFRYTPMQCAVISGYMSLILEMVPCGATYDEVDSDGNTLLHLAIFHKNERWDRLVISGGKKIIKTETEGAVVSILKILLDLGLNIDAQNKKGETPLSLAVQYRMKVVTELLVERNASLNIFGKTVTHYLIMDEIETFRRQEKNPNILEHEGPWTMQQKNDFMDWWLSKKLDIKISSNSETPLQLCVRNNMKRIFEVLLQYTDEINDVDTNGRTLLHILFGSIESSLRVKGKKCEIERAIEIVKILIKRGISVDKTDRCGNTPFHIAAKLKSPELMKTILKNFTNVNACNNMKETVLHIVAKNCCDEYEEDYLKIVFQLIGKGADVNCQAKYAKTPLHLICMKDNNVSKKIWQFLMQQGCNLNITDENGVTPLHLAIQAKSIEIIEMLINNGANVNCRENISHSTPLHEATKNNLSTVVEALLKAGAKSDVRDIQGRTPLHIAVSDSLLAPAMMSLLLMFGADVEVLDKEMKTPLYRAFREGDYKRIGMLLDYGAKIIDIERTRLMPSRSESSRSDSKTLIIKQLVARALAGLYVRNCYAAVVQRAQREFASFYEQCKQELNLLKITMIDDVSVYDILHMNMKRRFTYATKDSFKGFATDNEFLIDKYPIYRHIITASYWSVVKRKPLLDSAKVVWYRLTNVPLPEMCVEQILGYLENSGLKFLIEAGTQIIDCEN